MPPLKPMSGAQYPMWRSLGELAHDSKSGEDSMHRLPGWPMLDDAGRRRFLKRMSASLTLAGLGGCTREPQEPILPYVAAPLGQVAGAPRFYATAVSH